MFLAMIASGQKDGFTLGCRTKLHLCVMVCSNLMTSTILNSFPNPKYKVGQNISFLANFASALSSAEILLSSVYAVQGRFCWICPCLVLVMTTVHY